MTTMQPNNEVPEPMNQVPTTPADERSEKLAGGHMPQKQGPGHSHSDDDMKHKRSGGDVERDDQEGEGNENRRGGQHTREENDEESGKSRRGGRSRNM